MARNTPSPPDPRTYEQLRAAYLANAQAGRHIYDGWTTAEISAYNRRLMFGEDDCAFPSQEEWSRVVD